MNLQIKENFSEVMKASRPAVVKDVGDFPGLGCSAPHKVEKR
jgi:hypothetical protein